MCQGLNPWDAVVPPQKSVSVLWDQALGNIQASSEQESPQEDLIGRHTTWRGARKELSLKRLPVGRDTSPGLNTSDSPTHHCPGKYEKAA